jgi:hypothetical protein
MIQTEAQRQFYLGVAGIRLWYAREPLPGAAPSPEFQFPEPDEPTQPLIAGRVQVAGVPAKAVAPNPAPTFSESNQRGVQRIASLQALMEKKEEVVVGEEPPAQKSPVDAELLSGDSQNSIAPTPVSQVQAGKPFSLNIGVFSGERHILIAGISKEASLRLQEALAENILKSLGEELSKPAEWVQWPVFNNRLVAGGSVADLMSVMRLVLRGTAGKKVIVLGSIGGADIEAKSDGWLAETLERSPDIEFEYSLAELASNPASKRSLWQQLKPLVRA